MEREEVASKGMILGGPDTLSISDTYENSIFGGLEEDFPPLLLNPCFDADTAPTRDEAPLSARYKYASRKAQKESPLHFRLRWAVFTVYRRLFTIVFVANLVAFIIVMNRDRKLTDCVNAAAVNLLGVALARHPMVVNTLYMVICSFPRSSPLWIRRRASKIFHYGGVHSGCGVSCVVWYLGFIGLMSREFSADSSTKFSPALLVLSYLILVLLLSIVIFAQPLLRFKSHDVFEFSHRFGGWIAILLFWPLFFLFGEKARDISNQSLGRYLVALPAFWILLFLTATLIWPWLYLRKISIRPEYLSDHAARLHYLDQPPLKFGRGFCGLETSVARLAQLCAVQGPGWQGLFQPCFQSRGLDY